MRYASLPHSGAVPAVPRPLHAASRCAGVQPLPLALRCSGGTRQWRCTLDSGRGGAGLGPRSGDAPFSQAPSPAWLSPSALQEDVLPPPGVCWASTLPTAETAVISRRAAAGRVYVGPLSASTPFCSGSSYASSWRRSQAASVAAASRARPCGRPMIGRRDLRVCATPGAGGAGKGADDEANRGVDFAAPEDPPSPAFQFSDSDFFTRDHETAVLWRTLTGEPTGICVLTGPPNCGKTALLNHLSCLKGPEAVPIMTINCRVDNVITPAAMAAHLHELAWSFADWAQAMQPDFEFSFKPPGGVEATMNIPDVINVLFGKDFAQEADLASIIEAYDTLLDQLATKGWGEVRRPVIVIDEANVLMEWREEDGGEAQLQHLLRFFVCLTKESNRAHVVLASADFSLLDWLESKGVTTLQTQVLVLGDLSKEEAERYVFGGGVKDKGNDKGQDWGGLVKQFGMWPRLLADVREMWPEIHEMCGGNVGQLRSCLTTVKSFKSVLEGLKATRRACSWGVRSGLKPSSLWYRASPPAWTAEQYRSVLRLIAENPHHAVRRPDVERELGSNGELALKSMVQYNLLAVRSDSSLAHDLPTEVFDEDELDGAVITMPSPGHLFVVKQKHKRGELCKDNKEKKTEPGAQAPPSEPSM